MGITTERTKAARMTTVNLITASDAERARDEAERKVMLDAAAAHRAKKLSENAQRAGFNSFSEFVRAFADDKVTVSIREASA